MSTRERDLAIDRTDALAIAIKGILGAAPYVGSIAAEVVGNLIPNQRIDRIVAFIEALDRKVQSMDPDTLSVRLKAVENVDLFEDSLFQAARALTSERIDYIAHLFATSLGDQTVEHLYKKRLLQILGELNDAEVILLKSMEIRAPEASDFFARHRAVITGPSVHVGSPPSVADREALHQTFWKHLEELGLTAPEYERQRSGEIPELERETGRPRVIYTQVTRVGKLLLKFIGQSEVVHDGA